MKKIYLSALVGLLGLGSANAQQDPHYTQYMYNMSVVNPAYAGLKENLSLGLLHREQWVGIDGAPKTTTFFGNGRVGKNVGLGLSVISDKIGPVQENNIYGDFSYDLKLAPGHRLSLGLKAGVTMQKAGLFSDVNGFVPDPNDPAFAEDTNESFFNVGAGAFYYTDKYYIGLSVPNFMKNTYLEKNDRKFGSSVMHMFLTGGYVFDLSEEWKFKPSTMVILAADSPMSFDLSANFLYNKKLEFGATYRLEDSFGAMVNYAVLPNLRIGYAYDNVTSNLNVKAKGSHEIMILFDIFFKKRVSSSPRYF